MSLRFPHGDSRSRNRAAHSCPAPEPSGPGHPPARAVQVRRVAPFVEGPGHPAHLVVTRLAPHAGGDDNRRPAGAAQGFDLIEERRVHLAGPPAAVACAVAPVLVTGEMGSGHDRSRRGGPALAGALGLPLARRSGLPAVRALAALTRRFLSLVFWPHLPPDASGLLKSRPMLP